jgi:ATP-dependent Clp protease adaptor protein ClpS
MNATLKSVLATSLTWLNNALPDVDNPPNDGDGGTTVIERPPMLAPVDKDAEKTAKPPMFAVVLHNDSSTSPEFVVSVLNDVFGLNRQRATSIMMAAHTGGKATVAIYSREVAEAKCEQCRVKIARDGVNAASPGSDCELTFTVVQETDGE